MFLMRAMKAFWLKRALVIWASLVLVGEGQVRDDFNDGDDEGWTRLNPLSQLGGTADFSFPEGRRYRLQSGASPNPEAFGQSRVGSLREEALFSAFRIAIDLVSADPALEQDLGILARVTSPGLQTLDGYSVTIDTDESRIYLSRIDNEAGENLGRSDFSYDPDQSYRLVLHGFETRLLGELFEWPDLENPVTIVEAEDTTYAEGMSGIFGNAGQASGRVDGTFDNFYVGRDPDVDRDGMADPEEVGFFGNLAQSGEADFDGDGRSNARELAEGTNPTVKDSAVEVIRFERGESSMTLAFRALEGKSYQLERSGNLVAWSVDAGATLRNAGPGRGEFTTVVSGDQEYFRVVVPE